MQFGQNFDFAIKTEARKTVIFGNFNFWKTLILAEFWSQQIQLFKKIQLVYFKLRNQERGLSNLLRMLTKRWLKSVFSLVK